MNLLSVVIFINICALRVNYQEPIQVYALIVMEPRTSASQCRVARYVADAIVTGHSRCKVAGDRYRSSAICKNAVHIY